MAETKAPESGRRFTMAMQMMPPEREQRAAGLLRVAIVLDSYNVSAWLALAIADLIGAEFLIVAAVALLPGGATEGDLERSWLFRKYAAWDAGRQRSEDDPLRSVDVSGTFAAGAEIKLSEENACYQLAALEVDAVLWLAGRDLERFCRPPAAWKAMPRYGVWFYRNSPVPHFWEVYHGEPVTRSALEVLLPDGKTAVIDEAFSATEQGWSWARNRQVPYWRASTLLLRSLRRVYREGSDARDLARTLSQGGGPLRTSATPSNLEMAGFVLRSAARTVTRRIRYGQKESYWYVAYRRERSKFVSHSEKLDLRGFERIEAPAGHFYADPFVLQWRGRNYLFVEDYLFAERRGCISVVEIGSRGVVGEAERILDLPYHLSYPFVFEHEGELYMIPETLGAGRIELYRAVFGLHQWEFVKALQEDVQAVDTTLWVEDGRFYFFTNIAARGATANDDLYVFFADTLEGEWTAHPANPIVTDVRRSRGAGKLFRRNGRLIRPAQDCSVRYGYACQLNEIDVLSTTEYRERPIARIEPDWAPGLIGTHTINSNDELEVIDGQIYAERYVGNGKA